VSGLVCGIVVVFGVGRKAESFSGDERSGFLDFFFFSRAAIIPYGIM